MKYRMTVQPAIEAGNPWITFEFETAEQMITSRDTVAALLIFMQDKEKVMEDYSNHISVEEKIQGVWEEYEEFDFDEPF